MLGLRPLPRTLPAALRDITHARVEVRLSALRDLARLGQGQQGEAARTALATALTSDSSVAIRSEAAVALADTDAREHLAALVAAVDDAAPRVRQMAFVALGELGGSERSDVAAAVRDAVRDPVAQIRFQALIAAFKLLGASESGPLIRHAFGDADDEVRYIAWRLAEDAWGGADALPEPVSAAAHRALEDDSSAVRIAAALLLSRHHDEAGEGMVVELLNHPSAALFPEDEQAAIELCAERALSEAMPGLERRAFPGWSFSPSPARFSALAALAALHHPRARRELLRGLGAWTRDARTSAVAQVQRAGLVEALGELRRMAKDPTRADPEVVSGAIASLQRLRDESTGDEAARGASAVVGDEAT